MRVQGEQNWKNSTRQWIACDCVYYMAMREDPVGNIWSINEMQKISKCFKEFKKLA